MVARRTLNQSPPPRQSAGAAKVFSSTQKPISGSSPIAVIEKQKVSAFAHPAPPDDGEHGGRQWNVSSLKPAQIPA